MFLINFSQWLSIIIRQYVPRFCVFLWKQSGKTIYVPVDICPDPLDEFSKLGRILQAEKILHNFFRIDVEIFVWKAFFSVWMFLRFWVSEA